MQILEQFIHQNDIDILLVQEVTNNNIQNIRGYTSYLNVGTTKRGTAIIVKDPITITDIHTTIRTWDGSKMQRDMDN